MSKETLKTGITEALKVATLAIHTIEDVNATLEDVKASREGSQDNLLQAFKDAETLKVNAHAFKRLLCEQEGYSYKMYDAASDKMITVDGSEAPNVFKVNMSVATKAYTKAGSLSSFATWKELRDSLKEIDPLTDIKLTVKAIFKLCRPLTTSIQTANMALPCPVSRMNLKRLLRHVNVTKQAHNRP